MMQNITLFIFIVLTTAGFNSSVNASPSQDRGLQLAIEVDRRDSGFDNIVSTGTIKNTSSSGAVNYRSFSMTTAEIEGYPDRRLIVINKPASLKGTVFLTHSHINRPDDTWLLLPRQNRVRRMAIGDKSGRFLGSEFTLEDISPWEVEKYNYFHHGETACGASTCAVIENRPTFKNSAYSKQVELLNTDIYQPHQITYFNHSGKKVKILNFNNYVLVGEYWRPTEMKMLNIVTGDISTISFESHFLKQGVSSYEMTPQNLINLVN